MIPSLLNTSHWANSKLVAWWSALPDIARGPKLYDLSGQNNDLTITVANGSGGSTPWSPLVRPGSLGSGSFGPFVGGGTNWYAPSSINIDTKCPPSSGGTISFWLNPRLAYNDASNNLVAVQWPTPGTWPQFILIFASGNFYGGYSWNATEYRAVLPLNSTIWKPGQWMHLTLTWAVGSKGAWYLNGQQAALAPNTLVTPNSLSSSTLKIGGDSSWGTSAYLNAEIDDLAIWSYQMSAQQASQVYNESVSGWTSRITLPSQYKVFQFPAISYVTDSGDRTAAGGERFGGVATVDASMRSAAGGMTQGGSADSRYVPYVPTPSRPYVSLDPSHWANRSCKAWWNTLPNCASGLTWYDLNCALPATITKLSGSDSRANYCWSPSLGTNAGVLGGTANHDGALSSSYLGPFGYASTYWYIPTGLNINTLCPTAGTVSVWLCPAVDFASSSRYCVLSQSDQGATGNFVLTAWDGGFFGGFHIGGTGYRVNFPTSAWVAGKWIHLAMTWQASGTIRSYLNGQQVDSVSTPASLTVGTSPLLSIGASYYMGSYQGPTTSLKGGIDDLNIWDWQMNSAQINTLYHESLGSWSGRIQIYNPKRVFRPPFDLPLFLTHNNYSETGAGGYSLGGRFDRSSAWTIPTQGGMAHGGWFPAGTWWGMVGSGGMSDGGTTGTPPNTFRHVPSGGFADGGVPTWAVDYRPTASGGMKDGGKTSVSVAFSPSVSGGMKDGGTTGSPKCAYNVSPSGGLSDGAEINAPMAWDTFQGTYGTLLENHTSNDGGSWLKHPSYPNGAAKIYNSNNLYSSSGWDGEYLHSYIHPTADYAVSFLAYHSGGSAGYFGLLARYDSVAATGYRGLVYVNGTGLGAWCRIERYVNGTANNISGDSAVFAFPLTTNVPIKLVATGSTISLYINGVKRLSANDSTITSVGKAGVYLGTTVTTFRDFMSTGGGLRLTYTITGSGGECIGGHVATSGNYYVMVGVGGFKLGGSPGNPQMEYLTTLVGGVKCGGHSAVGLTCSYTASGGMSAGGAVALPSVSYFATGGWSTGGATDAPAMAFFPPIGGGLKAGGHADSAGVYTVSVGGGSGLGGSIVSLGVGYRIYSNTGTGDPIDYTTPIAYTTDKTWTSDALSGPAVWSFGVRAVGTLSGLEELNVDAAVTVRISGASTDITSIPSAPSSLTAAAEMNGNVRVSWYFSPLAGRSLPTGFRVYYGSPSVSYSVPVATSGYYGATTYSVVIPGLSDGIAYEFAVRAYNSTGEEDNTVTTTAVATDSGPSAVDSITLTAVAQG